jgi:tetratricopeptide (TPR) repeat protein
MSLKAELETWAAALKAYDEEDFEKALELFSVRLLCHKTLLATHFPDRKRIADSSKILTNMGLIYATLGEHEVAVERFIEATNLDQYLAVALVLSIIMSRRSTQILTPSDIFNVVSPISSLLAMNWRPKTLKKHFCT